LYTSGEGVEFFTRRPTRRASEVTGVVNVKSMLGKMRPDRAASPVLRSSMNS
jgi:hypothetical protein